MDVDQVLHDMNGGEGKTSNSNNSLSSENSNINGKTKSTRNSPLLPECLKIVDLGCSVGSNTLLVVWDIIENIHKTSQRLNRQPPSFQVFLNNLPGNDFNTLFKSLPGFYKKLEEEEKVGQDQDFVKCFISGVPGSFYGRFFPTNSLHFVHSSYSLMWLPKVPKGLVSESGQGVVNRGKICVAKTCPPAVHRAYLEEFQSGFTKFRAQELVPRGSTVLTTMGSIKSDDPLSIWECVGLDLNDMVSEGLIEEEKLDVFNLPYYAASKEEVKKLIEEEGSFELKKLEVFKMDWDAYLKKANSKLDEQQRAAIITTHIRAVGDSDRTRTLSLAAKRK